MPATLQKTTRHASFAGLTAAVAAAAVLGLAYAGTHAASHHSGGGSTAGPSVYLSPGNQSLTIGQNFTVELRENSGTTPVNAVQANLSYPASLFTVASIDTAGSSFSIDAQAADQGGTIAVARGTVSPLTGDQLVAHITFNARAKGTANLSFASGTALVDSVNNQNVLVAMPGGQYRIR